jgi:hypothetical protein
LVALSPDGSFTDELFAKTRIPGGTLVLHHLITLALTFGHGLIHALDSVGGLGGKLLDSVGGLGGK